jgi:hypothetical protein
MQSGENAAYCSKCGRPLSTSVPAISVAPLPTSPSPPPKLGSRNSASGVGCLGLIVLAIALALWSLHDNSSQPSHGAKLGVTHPAATHQAVKVANEKAIAKSEEADLKAAAGLLNQSGNLLTGYGVQGTAAKMRIDGDLWEPLSDQDKHLLEQTLEQAWTTTWNHYHSQHGATQLQFEIVNLADDRIYSDIIDLPDTPHPERVAYEQARLSGVGAYKVIEQWDIPCAGNGGIGQRAIVLSHKASDLPAAYHRFLGSLNGDRSKCITFEVFSNNDALAQSKSVSDTYTDAEMQAQWNNELQYMNNPNSGYEAYTFGTKRLADGSIDIDQHVLHQGN